MAKAKRIDLPQPGSAVELVCLKDSYDAVRGRVPPHGPTVIVRPGHSELLPVPGEIFTVEVERSWVFGYTAYVKGTVVGCRLDVDRLELPPLALHPQGTWDPATEPWLFEEDPSPLYDEIRAAGPRALSEMEQMLPEDAVELRWEDDPIVEAVALTDAGAYHEAVDLLGDLLSVDLRCLDAHAHLGNLELRGRIRVDVGQAERHYSVGVALGEQALGVPALDYPDLLPRGLIDNRPFLRCLHGLGLCRWRRGDLETAGRIFRRLVWLDPHDGLGARFLVADVEAGRSWEEATAAQEAAG